MSGEQEMGKGRRAERPTDSEGVSAHKLEAGNPKQSIEEERSIRRGQESAILAQGGRLHGLESAVEKNRLMDTETYQGIESKKLERLAEQKLGSNKFTDHVRLLYSAPDFEKQYKPGGEIYFSEKMRLLAGLGVRFAEHWQIRPTYHGRAYRDLDDDKKADLDYKLSGQMTKHGIDQRTIDFTAQKNVDEQFHQDLLKSIDDRKVGKVVDKEIELRQKTFTEDMRYLETERFNQLKEIYTKEHPKANCESAQKSAQAEIDDTYKQISYLLTNESKWKPGLTELQRTQLAMQVLHEAAHPTSISQGNKNTSVITASERARIFTREPSKAARLIAQMAVDGEYIPPGEPGIRIKANRFNLTPDSEARHDPTQEFHSFPTRDGERSFAGQILETTAVNIYLQKHGMKEEYVQTNFRESADDTGERFLDSTKTNVQFVGMRAKELVHDPGLGPIAAAEVHNAITGRPVSGKWLLMTKDLQQVSDLQNDRKTDPKAAQAIAAAADRGQMVKAIADAHDKGSFPMVAYVHTGQEPFRKDYVDGGTGSGATWHAVSIVGIENKDGATRYFIDNQWRNAVDHLAGMPGHQKEKKSGEPLTADQLWNAMCGPKKDANVLIIPEVR